MSQAHLYRFALRCLRRLLYLWVRSETISPEAVSSLANRSQPSPILYALEVYSACDLAVIEQECKRLGLPSPSSPVDLGGQTEKVRFFYLRKAPGWFSLRQRNLPPPRLLRLTDLVEKQQITDAQIIPVSVFWGQSPDRETSPWKLLFADTWAVTGHLRKFMRILILGRKTRVQFSAPMDVRKLLQENKDQERTQRMAQRILRVHFRNLRAAVIGPDISHRRTLVADLLQTDLVRQAIQNYAAQKDVPLAKAEARALKYGNEIASDFTFAVVRFFDLLLNWFWERIYDGIQVQHLDSVQQAAQGHEVIYVPCHRSHIDYLLLSWVLYRQGLSLPQIAAGINLNMPVVGGLLRRGGAFFMRRSFRDNPLYTAVFNEYLHTLYSRGFPVEYFIEGGRSRTGRLLQPRTGMLTTTLQSYLRSSRMPILFVPVYIGYERVLEGRTYLNELRGAQKKKESVFDLLKLGGILKQRFGRVRLNFGAPIQLSAFLDHQQPSWRSEVTAPKYHPTWLHQTTQLLAQNIAQRINGAVAISPIGLVGLALLSSHRRALDEPSLLRALDLYLTLLRRAPYSKYATLPEGNSQDLVDYVAQMGMLNQQNDTLGKLYYLDEPNAVAMTYYRNNLLHVFAMPALLASFFLRGGLISRDQISRFSQLLYPYLKAELFIRYSDEELEERLDQWLDLFAEQQLLKRENDGFRCPEPSSRYYVLLNLLAGAILPTLQRFYMAISLLLNAGQHVLSAEELEGLSTLMARRLSILHGLNAPEFFDKTLFRHFIQTLLEQGVLFPDEDGKLGYPSLIAELTEGVAKRVLPADLRLSIQQVTLGPSPDTPE